MLNITKPWLVIFLLVVVAISSFIFFGTHKSKISVTVAQAASTEQVSVDSSISQYDEGPNAAIQPISALPITSTSKPIIAQSLVSGCSLHFSFAPASKIVSVGGTVNYKATISNGGDTTCNNVSFSVYYSNNEAFVSSSPKPTASNYYWSVGNLASGKIYTVDIVTVQQSVTVPFQIDDEACATADNSADVCPENLIFVNSSATTQPVTVRSIVPVSSSELPTVKSSAMPPSYSNEYGVWVWQSPIQMAPGYAAEMVKSLEANNFNTVYVTIDDYLNIVSLPAGSDKNSKEEVYMKTLSDLVTMANKGGIAVDVEGGAKDWDSPENNWEGFALIDFVNAYNSAYPNAKVRNLQYDVEPYLLPAYTTDPSSVLTGFVAFIDASAARMKNVDAGFSVVIPHFYDEVKAWTPQITYDGRIEYTYNQLLDVLKQKPDSELVVMAYRNYFSGDNGIQDIVTPEISEASQGGYPTKVIVAQETGNVQPSYITYNGMSKADLFASIAQIETTFNKSSAFGGVAVHYLDPYLELK